MIPKTENIITEFKTSFGDEVIITLVAFSNAKGGSVYIGVNDKAELKGVEIGKETIQNWVNEVKNKTSPQIIPDVEVIDLEKTPIIVFSVPEYPIKPVSFRGRFYKRNGNANHLMSIDEIANEHLKTINTSWDYYIDPNHTPEAISYNKVGRFKSDITIIDSLSLNTDLFPKSRKSSLL